VYCIDAAPRPLPSIGAPRPSKGWPGVAECRLIRSHHGGSRRRYGDGANFGAAALSKKLLGRRHKGVPPILWPLFCPPRMRIRCGVRFVGNIGQPQRARIKRADSHTTGTEIQPGASSLLERSHILHKPHRDGCQSNRNPRIGMVLQSGIVRICRRESAEEPPPTLLSSTRPGRPPRFSMRPENS
jgi:hypothetical protein